MLHRKQWAQVANLNSFLQSLSFLGFRRT
jgi:hypothetical protein